MGLLRFILAASVIAAHSSPILGIPMAGGLLSVQLFFMISGYYMALILETKYLTKPDGYRLFLSNRFLRIFPSYFLILFLSIAFYTLSYVLTHNADRFGLWSSAFHRGDIPS